MADENTKKLAWRLEASWRWVKQLKGPQFCPLVPTVLNIGQFLEESHSGVWMQEQWLQHMAETTTGCCWVNEVLRPSIHVTNLVKAF